MVNSLKVQVVVAPSVADGISFQSAPGALRKLIVVLVAGLLCSCASAPESPKESVYTPSTPFTESAEGATGVLTEEILYKYLVGEIAGQRGQLDLAVENYIELARRLPDARVARRATQVAVYGQHDKEALEAATLWVKHDSASIEARQALAAMYIRHGDVDPALHQIEFILSSGPSEDGQTLRAIAGLLSREEDKAVALEVMEKLVAARRDNPDALFAYAMLAVQAGELDKGREAMERVLTLKPGDPNVATAYLGVLQKQNDMEGALDWLAKSLAERHDATDLRMLYGRLLADAKRFDEAREQFTILVQADPHNADAHYALGLLNVQTERLEEAKMNFMALIESGQRTNESSFYLGYIAATEDDLDTALDWYRAVDSGEIFFDAQLKIALLLARQGKVKEARAHLASVTVKGPEQTKQLVLAEAEILTEQDRYEDAMAVFDRALANGYDTDLLYARAMLAEKMGDIDLLERDLRQILEQEPKNAQTLNALGYTLADRTERYDEAYEFIKRALEISPNDYYILDSMGWALYRLGRLQESLQYLRKAREIRDDPEVAAHMAEVLWMMGDKQGARNVWETALKKTPEDEKLLDVIKRLSP